MGDLQDPRLIYLKAAMFLVIGAMSAGLLLAASPTARTALLLAVCIWSFCRLYYFAFYVIEHYVDGRYRFAGLFDFAGYLLAQWREGRIRRSEKE